jgi:hypothetical protein
MSDMHQSHRESTGRQRSQATLERLVVVPDCDQDAAIEWARGLSNGNVVFREYGEHFIITPESNRIPLTGESHQPLFGTDSFVCVEGATVVRRRLDSSTSQIVEESRLDLSQVDLGDSARLPIQEQMRESKAWKEAVEIIDRLLKDPSAKLDATHHQKLRDVGALLDKHTEYQRTILTQNEGGLTHMVACAEAPTVGIVYNNNLVLLRVTEDGSLVLDHSTLLTGKIVKIAARENDVVAAIYEGPKEYDGWDGSGRNSKIELYSSLQTDRLGTLKLFGKLGAGEANEDGLIALSGNGKMFAYTEDDGDSFEVCVSTVADAGSKASPVEVHRELYHQVSGGDALAFDASGSKLAIATRDHENILDVLTFDHRGQLQSKRSVENRYTSDISFDQDGNLLMVRVVWGEGEGNDTTELVRCTVPRSVTGKSADESLRMPRVDNTETINADAELPREPISKGSVFSEPTPTIPVNFYKSKDEFVERDFTKIKSVPDRSFLRETVRIFDKGDLVSFSRIKSSSGRWEPAQIINGTGVVLGYTGGGMNTQIVVKDDSTGNELVFPVIPSQYGYSSESGNWSLPTEDNVVRIIRHYDQGRKVGTSEDKFSLKKIVIPSGSSLGEFTDPS